MAATDQTYRNQKTMHVVFGVSCVLMLASVIWMFVQDFNREFKPVQRKFADVEEQLNLRTMLVQLPHADDLQDRINAAEQARKDYEKERVKLRDTEKKLAGEREIKDVAYRTIKASYDSQSSYYDIAVEEVGKETNPRRKKSLEEALQDRRKALDKLRDERDKAKNGLDEANLKFKKEITDKLAEAKKKMEDADDDLKRLTAAFDRFAKATVQKSWGPGSTIRALPIIDYMASPVKPNQIVLNDLTIDYSFKQVPRFDRCTTCHLGIDRPMFDKAALTALTQPSDVLNRNLQQARKLLIERQKKGEDLGFDPHDLPTKAEPVKLTKGEITQYATHPRLDLFVDGNSPHGMEKFGCTICHAGQGSSTSFTLASHTPADARQTAEWKKNHDWERIHDWDYPMHSSRFVEASCLQCHHQVTDLIRYGTKEEAPKLLRGYNLVKENGCFGCHEISGIKSGRPVGPDLRLEPTPALELLSAAEQEKAKADALNPPGTLRKVGPSLRRLAEKTNEEWVRKWVLSPRTFREDTKMPHFYGLSNNSSDVLPEDQKKFPDAEIRSIAHYLFAESKAHLKGADTVREYLIATVQGHEAALADGPLGEKDRKELLEASRNFANLALLSNGQHAAEINALALEQKKLQDQLQDLRKREADLKAKELKAELDEQQKQQKRQLEKDAADAAARLKEIRDKLVELAKPVGVQEQVFDYEGKPVGKDILEQAGDDKQKENGKRLFIEKGCMACHSHAGTEDKVIGEANFAPNLSRIAAKLGKGEGADDKQARRWLVQWLLNPTIYHPRTRMPVTFLTPADAGDIATWLLSQPVKDYQERDPADPDTETLVAMARLYLSKAPGMTMRDVDTFLPKGNDLPPGINDANRQKIIAADADERRLIPKGPDGLSAADLKWYIGKKSISRLGCYGCHDLPGFEQAKPIGTALNDWGKKDPERLAFEDAEAFVNGHYNIVEARDDARDKTKADAKWRTVTAEENGREVAKEPFEKYFADALEHHHREGFLHLKLAEPRSYDYNRLRVWDDRLRMPQFQFSKPRRHKDESAEEYENRKTREEAQAREAVMTFILGLVADPIPLKYVHNPNPDKAAEVRGRQVLDKFNCAGCHQVRPGVYEFRPSKDALDKLEFWYKKAAEQLKEDYLYPMHNAWTGNPSPYPDRMIVYGVGAQSALVEREDNPEVKDRVLQLRNTDAVRFTNNDRLLRDIPASSLVTVPERDLLARSDSWGGHFADLLLGKDNDGQWDGYLTREGLWKNKPDDARSTLPPPLIREGERVQSKWLYQFLLNPTPIRPQTHMKLRMPRFNMSPEESQALVNYFAAAAKTGNPAVGLTYPYDTVPQRDPRYWTTRSQQYAGKLDGKDLDARAKEFESVWLAEMKTRLDQMKATADELEKAKKDDELAKLKKEMKELEDRIGKKDVGAARKEWQANNAYATDAYKLLTNKELCLKCHSIGSLKVEGAVGPPLDLAAERLRPEWTLYWLSNPKRLFPYNTQMPQNFPNGKPPSDLFHGQTPEQLRAIRDALMDLPRLADLPENRKGAGGK